MLIVQKYGGTSVADIDRIGHVANRIASEYNRKNDIVVIVSALAGETDRLLGLTEQVSKDPLDREIDIVISTGEQVSSGLLALALKNLGVPATTLLPFQIPIVTDGIYGRARIDGVASDRIKNFLKEGRVVVIPGFQGISKAGEVTTLGRGGSDTSAVAVAAALGADCCEIYTDVEGVYTADPSVCPEAKKIKRLTYDEMLEIAGAGAKIVQMRAVELAAKFNLPLHIRSSFTEPTGRSRLCAATTEGTEIVDNKMVGAASVRRKTTSTPRQTIENPLVTAITHTKNEAKVAVRQVPNQTGAVSQVFEPLAKANINVDMIVQNISGDNRADIAFTVDKHDLKKALALTERSAAKIDAGKVEAAGDVSKISIIGVGMRSHAGVASKMFKTLGEEGIEIHLISTSEIKVSAVVDMKHTEKAVKTLHKAFGLS